MKTSELVSKLKSMGYQVKAKSRTMNVYTPDGKYAGNICTKVFGTFSTDTWVTTSGKLDYNIDVVDTLTTYALTPLDEREDTKEYKEYVVIMLPGGDNYINQNRKNKRIFLSSKDETDRYKTQFTEKKYNKVQEQNATWLPMFDKSDPHFVEVPDDEYEEW